MLYYLFDYLQKIGTPGMGAFSYTSTRAALALIVSLLISTLIGSRIIDWLRGKQMSDPVRPLDIEGQMAKVGTPTMGGIIIIIAILIPTLLFNKLNNIYIILMVITTLWLGMLGFMDDYVKVFKKNKDGIHGRYKLIAQLGLGVIVALVLLTSPSVVIKENIATETVNKTLVVTHSNTEVKSTKTTIPFLKDNNLDYSEVAKAVGVKQNAELLTFLLVTVVFVFIVMAVSNAANLTDGLDGLAAGSSAIIGVALGIFAYMSSHIQFASYLNIMFIPGAEELVIFAASFIGATVGFLWYNSYPAQVFMGDTGSLTIGGIIAVFAIIIRKELLLPILCGVFFVEALSVILQTTFFKITKKRTGTGRRVFKMTPLHHHFQKPSGVVDALIQGPTRPIAEAKITVRFWLIGILLAVLTIVTLKLR
ncbi:Phospho-N-acetylmuramoyl-pentapeptide-transferase [Porphyromonas levii]|uniref:Phospho-N-acetylmuramoyl-pentapeptide-transferase n=1 Tax=Porphyromonas levii TaxID=28114 RepID=A0A4Y8WPB0_9PORP|nr:phospho-N-acetylmuramoyl-pentapeptide-transferase [Porphyromonas levii]MBR8784032.1 Phospho-N-acetylmuramoyl-pentapeptide-transferase [Porphyromonas levii]TFH94849.1 phospho-N-acetylmuramoyl-pentapeptide-transferase [Porphyromonas levii]TFH95503.1 phospho-N-acetylmuramoyl-pentapeptide-transferase [Porphyromonas levii]